MLKVLVLSYFDFTGEKGWFGVHPCGCWVKGAKMSTETAAWNGCLAAPITVWNRTFDIQVFTGKGETTVCQNHILLQGQKMWPWLSYLNLPAVPNFQCQKICPSQSGKRENLVWVHYSSYNLAWMAITFLAFWHQLCRWARAGLPSVPRSVKPWLLSCIVISE